MKRLLPLFLLLLLASFKPKTPCPTLQFEGLYVHKIDNEHSAVIRFYQDKTVIVSSSLNDYKEVMTWFNREPENFSRVLTGKYKISKGSCTISFKVKGESGEQKFYGTIGSDNTLQLHISNPAQYGKKAEETDRKYTFVKP